MNDLIGGRYRIHRRLGQGGMGAVYEATDEHTGQRVAVKVVTAQVAKNELLLGRFEREVRAARGLETPHVVRFLDAGRDPASGLPFLVMEVLEGEDVARVFKRTGPMRPDLAMRIVGQACLGLEAAHAQRIVHRDIKPANLFLTRSAGGERTVKILDFGIAKLAPDMSVAGEAGEATGLTQTGSMLGSPLYMSPEQARGHKNIDGRADIWSLGVVLYAALAGRTPHQDNDALGDLIIAICTEPAPPVTHLAPWVPPEVAAIVHRALSLDPAGRFQTAAELRAALGALLPGGFAIREDMLVGVPEAERALRPHAEPRASAAQTNATPRGAYTMSDEPTARYTGPSLGISPETPAALQMGPIPSSPPPGPHTTTVRTQRARVGAGVFAAAGLVVAVGVGVATFLISGRPSPGAPAPASNAIEAPEPAAAPAPAPAPAPASTAAPAPATASAVAPGASAATLPSGRVPGPMPRPTGAAAKPAGPNDIYFKR
jgi:serine/threonine-protein kinase